MQSAWLVACLAVFVLAGGRIGRGNQENVLNEIHYFS